MIDLGLNKKEQKAFEKALRSTHRIRLEVQILDSNEKPVGNLTYPSNCVLEGSVQVSVEGDEATRILELTLLDPGQRLPFVPNNVAQGGIYAENFIAVRYCVEVLELEDWVEVPVFWGPLTRYTHDGSRATIEAKGKETLAMAPHVLTQGFTIKKRTRLDDAIKKVMRKTGERRFNLPSFGDYKLQRDYVVKPMQEGWKVVTGGADDEGGGKVDALINLTRNNHFAFYDGRGRCTVRRTRRPRQFRFTDEHTMTRPTLSYDVLSFVNLVSVTGAEAKGSKKAVSAKVRLPPAHPLSPHALARNGEPRILAKSVKAPNLKTTEACREKAAEVLDSMRKAGIEVTFESLVIPHLEEWDDVAVETEHGLVEFVLKEFTIPLTATETMSVGFQKRVRQYARGSGLKRDARREREARRAREQRRRKRRRQREKNK